MTANGAQKTPLRRLELLIAERFVWLLPVALSLFCHAVGAWKANLGGDGPGLHLALMNDRTIRVQRLWQDVDERRWLFAAYALLIFFTYYVLLRSRSPVRYRVICGVIVAAPGFWC